MPELLLHEKESKADWNIRRLSSFHGYQHHLSAAPLLYLLILPKKEADRGIAGRGVQRVNGTGRGSAV